MSDRLLATPGRAEGGPDLSRPSANISGVPPHIIQPSPYPAARPNAASARRAHAVTSLPSAPGIVVGSPIPIFMLVLSGPRNLGP
jgi:hypothetical protein